MCLHTRPASWRGFSRRHHHPPTRVRDLVPTPVHALVNLRAAGVGVLLDLTDGQLPAVMHWGADLGPTNLEEARALVLADVRQVGANQVDTPLRTSLLPEHWTGWTGRPGLSGSRQGRAWSPKFTTVALRVDGEQVDASSTGTAFVDPGSAWSRSTRSTRPRGLALTLTLELHPSGLLRTRATRDQPGRGALPGRRPGAGPARCPPSPSELLDFGGRWGKERIPQRRALRIGTAPAGGPQGPDRRRQRRRAARGHARVRLRRRARSGPCTPAGAATTSTTPSGLSTGEQVIGGGELLLPGEVRLGPDETYTAPVGLRRVRRRAGRGRPAVPPLPAGPAAAIRGRTARSP